MKKKLKVFISSPGDVGQERLITTRVFDRLQGEFAAFFEFEILLWEHEPLRATAHFQAEIPHPSESDIVVLILWSRLGTRLPEQFNRPDGTPYDSGTEWEFEDALKGFEEKGSPDILAYRKTAMAVTGLQDEQEILDKLKQKKALDKFCDNWFGNHEKGFAKAYHVFETPDQFEDILETQLRNLILSKVPEHAIEEGGIPEAQVRWHKGSPFRGLERFDYDHAPVFFGRTKAIGEVKDALAHRVKQDSPFVLILGMSGGGKSSLALAGVIPTIIQPGVIEGVGLWRWNSFRPSDAADGDLLGLLATALFNKKALPELGDGGFKEEELVTLFSESMKGAISAIKVALNHAAEEIAKKERLTEPPEARVVIVIDQMEELFTENTISLPKAKLFIKVVAELVRSGLVWVIGTMRSDFFHRCADIQDLMDLKEGEGQYHLIAPSFAEIGQIIRQPTLAAGLRFESNPKAGTKLDDIIHEAAAKSPESLPLLQFTLDELFNKRTDENVLTFKAYEDLGGIEGALAKRAEDAFTELPSDVQKTYPTLMRALVTVSAEGKATARRAPVEKLIEKEALKKLIDAFIEARLLVSDRTRKGIPVIRIAHEALIVHWPRLQEWLKHDLEFLGIRSRIADAAEHWEKEGKDNDLLLRPGKPLTDGNELLKRREELDPILAEYIEASVESYNNSLKEKEREALRKLRRIRVMAGVFGVLAVFAAIGGYFGFRGQAEAEAQSKVAESEAKNANIARHEAEKQTLFAKQNALKATRALDASDIARKRAELLNNNALRNQSLFLADIARRLTEDGRPDTAMLLALEALPRVLARSDRPYVIAAESALYDALKHFRQATTYTSETSEVANIFFSKDKTKIIAVMKNGAMYSWKLAHDNRQGKQLREADNKLIYTSSSPDHRHIIATSSSGRVHIWNIRQDKVIEELVGHRGAVNWAEFSPDGKYIITASADTTIRLWDGSTFKLLKIIEGHQNAVTQAVFTQDSKELITTSDDQTIRVWSLPDGEQTQFFKLDAITPKLAYNNALRQIAFIPKVGRASILIRDTGAIHELPIFHDGPVSVMAFSPDGLVFASGSEDRTGRLINAKDRRLIAILDKHKAAITSLSFSPNSKKFVTSSKDGTVKIWSAKNAEVKISLAGQGEDKTFAHYRNDTNYLAVGDNLGRVQIWNMKPDSRQLKLQDKDNPLTSIAYSHSGNRLLTGSKNGDVLLWDTSDGEQLARLRGHGSSIRHAVFSPNDQIIATTSDDGNIRLWSNSTAEPLYVIYADNKEKGVFLDLKFSTDSQYLLGTSTHGLGLWNTKTAAPVFQNRMISNGEPPIEARFLGNKNKILVLAKDGGIHLITPGENEIIRTINGRAQKMLALNNKSTHLVAADHDGSVRIWRLETRMQTNVFIGHKKQVIFGDFIDDETKLITGSIDGEVRIWDTQTGYPLWSIMLPSHMLYNAQLDYSRQRLLTSAGSFARIWDVNSASELIQLEKSDTQIKGSFYHPKGRQVAISSEAGFVYLLPLFPTSQDLINHIRQLITRTLTPKERKEFFLNPW